MKKEEIRKEFFKLKGKGHSYNQCRKLLKVLHDYCITTRTLKRWEKKFQTEEWDFRDKSRRPQSIQHKVTCKQEEEIISLRKRTGWGERKIESFVSLGHTTINKILRKHKLCDYSKRKKRIKYIRFQREHPNSMWQMDLSVQKIEGKWCLSIIDDCSRYSLALIPLNRATTKIVTLMLDELIAIHGKPREILTDNGSVFGLRSKHSKFDRWCRRRDIKHIRTAIHSPTTTGKVERLFQTMKKEMPFCNNDSELFRMRYNHLRPHTSLNKKTPAKVYFDFAKLF